MCAVSFCVVVLSFIVMHLHPTGKNNMPHNSSTCLPPAMPRHTWHSSASAEGGIRTGVCVGLALLCVKDCPIVARGVVEGPCRMFQG